VATKGWGLGAAVVARAIVALVSSSPAIATAQSAPHRFELGMQAPMAASSEFDRSDVGIGGRVAWRPTSIVGLEAEMSLFPRDFPRRPAFSRSRAEGLFGVTLGPAFGRVRPFAKVRPGFLQFREAPQPLACIAIFPPPLSCVLASGRTLLALDIGGGIEIFPTPGTFVRAEAGDRLVRYPGQVFDATRTAREQPFFGHGFRFAIGAGLRF
jgi:hypothetical protein